MPNYKRQGKPSKSSKKFRTPQIKKPVGGGFWTNLLSTILIFIIILSLYSFFFGETKEYEEIAISQLASDVRAGLVGEIVVKGENIEAVYTDESLKKTKKEVGTPITETLTNYGVLPTDLESVKIEINNPTGLGFYLLSLAPFIVPIIFIIFFIWYLSRQVKGAGMQAFTFGQSKARFIDPKDKSQRLTFKDVAGVKEAKEELFEIVQFLKNPKKFLDIGARIPKGVILMGPSGTGKTLLARAVAGEAGVPFFLISGSEFVEMFVGVGASRVRDLFKMAKKGAPAIIFVDEIDAVGRVRGTGVGGGNDEREQTLNQILVEMDGFEPNEKVIVMAATNRPDVLDPALIRPGRFDRRVRIDLPDRDEREAILLIHARKKPLTEDVNFRVVAERTPGLSGADLQSIMNEGAILAAREDRKQVSQYDLIRSIEKVMLGPERKSHILSLREKKITAYHEAGHALVSSVLEYADPVHKVSIISRGHAAGYTMNLPLEERRFRSKKDFMDNLVVLLGGYVVEQMVFEDLTTGPSNDLKVTAAIVKDMVTRYGMSDKIGPIAILGDDPDPYGRTVMNENSPEVGNAVAKEVHRIINEAKDRALKVVKEHRKLLDIIAKALIEKETLERDEFEQILVANGITPKKDLSSDLSFKAKSKDKSQSA
ncbi:cell division protein FtsH [Candidatus Campbellbacteria bacterium CG11_big_fil_rev_8_21_14_0_20_44_21]|uniref:ATP-dependent zinc metalloprotease FtsH n=1 Tax=Candidatus Campbellbacteria bacterium CG22_combo_CG10-13_8_21_14_all_43_18 TaxID=1974530 RepID=A0A2H0DW86_9BACT|nr:MAG: cell division protein FtsH [Candidatus Campbellbacteria bacterium CG22_combo_CG10-13_8_21_14_all_43_18]PIR24391.1 MAG: cell division protein FtsH [Candidatus Campbellbacteria bacterium CG11_big_fil_rev_8_21_14_0_20_44_21]